MLDLLLLYTLKNRSNREREKGESYVEYLERLSADVDRVCCGDGPEQTSPSPSSTLSASPPSRPPLPDYFRTGDGPSTCYQYVTVITVSSNWTKERGKHRKRSLPSSATRSTTYLPLPLSYVYPKSKILAPFTQTTASPVSGLQVIDAEKWSRFKLFLLLLSS
jgi:hypothetical protein